MKRYTLHNAAQAEEVLSRLREHARPHLMAGQKLVVEVKPETRSLQQNAALWAALTDISEQVAWHGRRLSPESWKHVFTASLSKQDVVPGIDGGFVVLGKSTSAMTKRELGDLLDLIHAFGAAQGVTFSDCAEVA